MAAAARAADLNTPHSVARVFDLVQVVLIERSVKRWPAGPGIELVF